jgi:hypothetical protein
MNGRFWSPSVDGTVYSNLADPSVTDDKVLQAGNIHTAGWQTNFLKYYNQPNYNSHGNALLVLDKQDTGSRF